MKKTNVLILSFILILTNNMQAMEKSQKHNVVIWDLLPECVQFHYYFKTEKEGMDSLPNGIFNEIKVERPAKIPYKFIQGMDQKSRKLLEYALQEEERESAELLKEMEELQDEIEEPDVESSQLTQQERERFLETISALNDIIAKEGTLIPATFDEEEDDFLFPLELDSDEEEDEFFIPLELDSDQEKEYFFSPPEIDNDITEKEDTLTPTTTLIPPKQSPEQPKRRRKRKRDPNPYSNTDLHSSKRRRQTRKAEEFKFIERCICGFSTDNHEKFVAHQNQHNAAQIRQQFHNQLINIPRMQMQPHPYRTNTTTNPPFQPNSHTVANLPIPAPQPVPRPVIIPGHNRVQIVQPNTSTRFQAPLEDPFIAILLKEGIVKNRERLQDGSFVIQLKTANQGDKKITELFGGDTCLAMAIRNSLLMLNCFAAVNLEYLNRINSIPDAINFLGEMKKEGIATSNYQGLDVHNLLRIHRGTGAGTREQRPGKQLTDLQEYHRTIGIPSNSSNTIIMQPNDFQPKHLSFLTDLGDKIETIRRKLRDKTIQTADYHIIYNTGGQHWIAITTCKIKNRVYWSLIVSFS